MSATVGRLAPAARVSTGTVAPASIGIGLALVGGVIAARAIASDGFYWADDYAHLLISRLSVHDWHAVLNPWGRPLMTVAYIPAALAGESAARITSLALLLVAAALVAVTARRWGLAHPPLAALLLLAQPLVAMIGYSALPQTMFSAVLAGAFALRAGGRHRSSALLVSLLPLARLEGIAVLAVWAAVLVRERRFRLLPLLACGLTVWAAVGAAAYSDVLWLYHANPYGVLGSAYPAAGFVYGFRVLPSVCGGGVLVCALLAILRLRLIDPMLTLTAGGLFGFYVVAWTLPAFQTLATPVYLVSLAVPIALLAHHGIAAVLQRLSARVAPPVLAAAVLAVSVSGAIAIQPLQRPAAERAQSQLASLLGHDADRVVVSTHPAFDWFAGTQSFLYVYGARSPAAGDYLIWDGNVGAQLGSVQSLLRRGYTVRWSSGQGFEQVVLLVKS